ncbi:hypothetical protein F5878DRAFT_699544 [Lentinula raphanica]|uniref:Uncharacterized protein n=1 Tax=Lentinula raphanica TaxID=153919 RepID=A0AA38U7C2_9AGAR|nr:hypothetical protein F5878DRAFT_699544 [Lentinula raphanica]
MKRKLEEELSTGYGFCILRSGKAFNPLAQCPDVVLIGVDPASLLAQGQEKQQEAYALKDHDEPVPPRITPRLSLSRCAKAKPFSSLILPQAPYPMPLDIALLMKLRLPNARRLNKPAHNPPSTSKKIVSKSAKKRSSSHDKPRPRPRIVAKVSNKLSTKRSGKKKSVKFTVSSSEEDEDEDYSSQSEMWLNFRESADVLAENPQYLPIIYNDKLNAQEVLAKTWHKYGNKRLEAFANSRQ